jgi:hypothetical protein
MDIVTLDQLNGNSLKRAITASSSAGLSASNDESSPPQQHKASADSTGLNHFFMLL